MASDNTIIHTGALGDLCLALVFARRTNWLRSGDRVDVLATHSLGRLEYDGVVAEVRHWDTVQAYQLFAGDDTQCLPALIKLVEKRRVLSFLGPERDEAIQQLKPAELISIDPVAQSDRTGHILEQWLSQTELRPNHDWLMRPVLEQPIRSGASNRKLIIHPGSGGAHKCWPWPAFRKVIQSLQGQHRVTITLGPVELEQWPAEQRTELESAAPAKAPDLSELAQLLRTADLLISNDSGPAHFAALLGTPTVTLFGPTSSDVWRPIGADAHAIQGNPAKGADWGITPEAVHNAVIALVNGF